MRAEGGPRWGSAPHLQGLVPLQEGMKSLRWDKGTTEPWSCCMRKPWQYCRHPGTPCPACSTANQLPAKARAGGASQQDGTGAVGQTDISYRAVLGRSWSLLTLHPAGPALCKALELPAKSTCATCATPCKASCSSEVPWAWLCWMQSISNNLGSSVSLLLSPPWTEAYVRP